MSMMGNYPKSATRTAAVERAMKMLSEGKSDKFPTREETQARMEARRKEQEVARQERVKKDAADLPNLEKQHAELSAIHAKGKNWRYADREQNLSDEERQARDVEGSLSDLGNRISAVKKSTPSYAKGGKISLGDCGVSTASKGKKNSSW